MIGVPDELIAVQNPTERVPVYDSPGRDWVVSNGLRTRHDRTGNWLHHWRLKPSVDMKL